MIMRMLKRGVKSIPPIRRLVERNRELLEENASLITENERLRHRASEAVGQSAGRQDELAGLHGQLDQIAQDRQRLADLLPRFGTTPPYVPNGHYYSPIPSLDEIRNDESRLFGKRPTSFPAIDLNESVQLEVLKDISAFYADLPFDDHAKDGLRYRYVNPSYSYSDGIFLNGMLRLMKPRRVIEIGSGFTSAMFLDTNELWFDNAIDLTFIEPYPDLLYSLFKPGDRERVKVHPTRLQDVDISVFASLEAGDFLFVDSTHVSRIGSDVNYIFFDILPVLKPGVFVHFHDIFYPLEYPKNWIMEGRAWNEIYLLRAFLQYNRAFEIVLFNTYLETFHAAFFEERMPLCMKNKGGSIWLRKLDPGSP